MQSALKRFGGQYYTAPRIVKALAPHDTYIEPYFGSGAVLFAKPHAGINEIINDIECDLTLFWMALQNPESFEALQRRLVYTPFSEHLWQAAARVLSIPAPPPDDGFWQRSPGSLADRAFWYFIHVRQSLGGRQEDFAPLSLKRRRRGMNEQASAWIGSIEGLPQVHERIKGVVILAAWPALKVIDKYDKKGVQFYLDPPFPHEVRKAGGYKHEMTREDHEKLLLRVLKCKAAVALSSYPNRLYDDTLKGWTRHDFEMPNNASHAVQKERETHALYTNY